MEILVFFGGLGPFRPPNSAKLFLGQPHYSALRKEKKSPHFFSDLKWVQTCAKPRFIEIEIEKSRFLIEKISTPNSGFGRSGFGVPEGGAPGGQDLEGADPGSQWGGAPLRSGFGRGGSGVP